MNLQSAEIYLPCYRPGRKLDGRISKAVRYAEGDEGLQRKLKEQTNFDEQMMEAIRFIRPPENLRQRLGELASRPDAALRSLRDHARHPAILCAIAGVLLILGFLIYLELDRRADFPGKDNAERMVDALRNMSGVELEPTKGGAGGLGDWFYMRGFEGFALPEDLAAMPVVGSRTFRLGGHLVGQVAVDRHETIMNVFRGSDFGVRLEKEPDWTLFEQEGWAAAIRQRGDICTLLAFRGERADMELFLKNLQP